MSTPPPVRAVIHDCDGPICNSYDKGIQMVRDALAPSINITFTDEILDALAREWGRKGCELLSVSLGIPHETGKELYDRWIALEKHDQPEMVEGSHETLLHLRDLRLVQLVLTSRPHRSLLPWMRHVGIDKGIFRHVATTCGRKYHKPDPRAFVGSLRVLRKEGIHPDETIFVGDTWADWKAGTERGITTFLVRTGPFGRFEPDAWGLSVPPEQMIDSLAHLPGRLRELGRLER